MEYFLDAYHEIGLRRGLKDVLKDRLGGLEENEVYGYCSSDAHNSNNLLAEKVNQISYLNEILVFINSHPRNSYTDIYDLPNSDLLNEFVLKKYYGYGFEIPEELYGYTHLKALAIYKQSINDLSAEKLLLFNDLNSLSLDDLHGFSQETLDVIHKLPYMVDLSLSNLNFYNKKDLVPLPKNIGKLENLQNFCFSDNNLEGWSELLKLKNLKFLDLSNCNLTEIPESISQLKYLEELNLSNNAITVLPEGLMELDNLKALYLNNNRL